ncbi:MAG: PEP-CTERM sorting domain-containing protein [Phycisphaerae bacterium]
MSGDYHFRISHANILVVFMFCLIFTNVPSRAVIIDDFTTAQSVSSNSSNSVTGPGILGGERDAEIYSSYASANVNQSIAGQLYYKSGKSNLNYLYLVYDGVDASSSNRDYDGLGHIDLTDGGTCNGIMFNFGQIPSYWVNAWITIKQGESISGYASASLENNAESMFVPFDEFTINIWPASIPEEKVANSDTLIDFTDVGYIEIQMNIWGGDDVFTIDSISTAYGIPEPATLLLFGLGSVILRRPVRRSLGEGGSRRISNS